MLCNRCGTDNQIGTRFCTNCGADLMEQAQHEQNQAGFQQPTYQQFDYQQNNYQQQPYQQQYQQPYYQQQMYQQPMTPAEPGRGFAIASLVLGIVSFICFPIITGGLGIAFGIVAKKKGSRSPMATAGIICGIVGIVLWIALRVLILVLGLDVYSFAG
ncbi:MAG: DUF4190 domain-containing protein [Acutalibacteraceae bacterium]|nr:DUF4190 domain-containing protein [Acutalibacteraceae bacterium]